VFISAATGQGASELAAKVAATCGGAIVPVVLRANCANGRLMQFIARYAHIRAERFSDSQAVIKAELPANRLAELRVFGQDVQIAPDPACSR
jgi:50S ribosomal subunit-associated GTPase HflX